MAHSDNTFTPNDGYKFDVKLIFPIGNHAYGFKGDIWDIYTYGHSSGNKCMPVILNSTVSSFGNTPSIDFSDVKNSIDDLMNSSVKSMIDKLPNYKDKQLNFKISFSELYNYINSTPINQFTDNYKSIYNGVNLDSPLYNNLADNNVTITDESSLINYINTLKDKFINETNNITKYSNAFIESYNNYYRYMQSMDSKELKSLFNYCINKNLNLLPKIDVLYEKFLGTKGAIYLPTDYQSDIFNGYKKYNDHLWYKLGTNTVDLATCIQYNEPTSVTEITIK